MMNKLLNGLSFSRLMLYLLLFGALPLLFIPLNHNTKSKRLAALEERLRQVQERAYLKEQKQEINTCVRNTFAKADPAFLEKNLGSLELLQSEREALEKMMKECSFPGGAANEGRIEFLGSGKNKLVFEGSHLQSRERVEEELETLTHPVEIDSGDLKTILSLIEERQPGQPELLITDFHLNKKITPNKNEVYELNLQVLKREFPS